MQLNPKTPTVIVNLERVTDPETRIGLRNLFRSIEQVYSQVAKVCNFNMARGVSQDAQPSIEDGEAIAWRDTDAGAGTPKAYLVVRIGAETFTFKSDQLV